MKTSYDIIDQLLPDDVHEIDLFHYTSADGLLGILNNKSVRCSQIFYLNDLEEYLNGWQFFNKVFDKYKNDHKYFENFRKTIETHYINWRNVTSENNIMDIFKTLKMSQYSSFVFSLSEVEDDLNQWRSYSQETFGFSFKFNFDKIFRNRLKILLDHTPENEQQPNNCRILLRRCVYDNDKKEEKIQKLLDYSFQNFLDNDHNWTQNLFFNILTLCLFFKNKNFEAEKECRMVVSTLYDHVTIEKSQVNILKIRKGKSFLIPYIDLEIDPFNIKGITVGPTPFKHHSYESLKMVQKTHQHIYDHINITHSKIPFRSW